MNAADFVAEIIATGRIRGVGVGSRLTDVEAAIPLDYIDDVDEDMVSLRRDYGLVEFFFNDGPDWVVVGATLELHRLATTPELAEEWRSIQGVEFTEFLPWGAVEESLSHRRDAPDLRVGSEQKGYTHYLAHDTGVSVFLVESDEEDDSWPSRGDVFSVSLESRGN